MRARRTALGLSGAAVFFSLIFGVLLRRWLAFPHPDDEPLALAAALSFLLVAYLLRIIASIFELLWLERTWGNLPEDLRKIGPIDKVESGMVIAFDNSVSNRTLGGRQYADYGLREMLTGGKS